MQQGMAPRKPMERPTEWTIEVVYQSRVLSGCVASGGRLTHSTVPAMSIAVIGGEGLSILGLQIFTPRRLDVENAGGGKRAGWIVVEAVGSCAIDTIGWELDSVGHGG